MAQGRITRRGPEGAAGFTIFEVGMAAAIMALALVSSITVMQRAFNALDTARAITYATQIMQNEMEKMRLLNWATVSAYPTTATTVTIDSAFTNTSIGSRFIGMTRAVETIHTNTNGGMRKITLTVSWKTVDGRTLTRSFVTYYGQNGLYDYFSS
jgi:type II secretory pathway pseudopilin PulG